MSLIDTKYAEMYIMFILMIQVTYVLQYMGFIVIKSTETQNFVQV